MFALVTKIYNLRLQLICWKWFNQYIWFCWIIDGRNCFCMTTNKKKTIHVEDRWTKYLLYYVHSKTLLTHLFHYTVVHQKYCKDGKFHVSVIQFYNAQAMKTEKLTPVSQISKISPISLVPKIVISALQFFDVLWRNKSGSGPG